MLRIIIVMLILLSAIVTTAQEDDEALQVWEVVERCAQVLPEAPTDPAFEGIITTTGWAGIHGINAEWDVPRVLAFDSNWAEFGGFDISPSGRYLIATIGIAEEIQNNVFDITIERFQVYDLAGEIPFEPIETDLTFTYAPLPDIRDDYAYVAPRWVDDSTFLYEVDGDYVGINAETGEQTLWEGDWNVNGVAPLASPSIASISPDFSRLLTVPSGSFGYVVVDTSNSDVLATLGDSVDFTTEFNPLWRADSSAFVMNAAQTVGLYDADGNLTEIIAEGNLVQTQNAWSPDERYLVLTDTSENASIYVADFDERVVYDTCVDSTGRDVAWHPTNGQFTLFALDEEADIVHSIFDANTWTVYSSGREHSGSILGWFAN
ncbi:MAG: hypothetical protein AAFR81_06460 [Chloroflexota bacterium]